MLTETDIREAIRKIVVGFEVDELEVGTDFIDAGMDSLDHVDVLLCIQETHGLHVPDGDVEDCRSIHGILEFAERTQSE